MTKQILIVLTSHDRLGESGEKTGWHAEEFTTPYYQFIDTGHDVTIASVKGGSAPVDPSSIKPSADENPESVQRYLKDENLRTALQKTISVDDVNPQGFDAVYIPGGHGTMWDFPKSQGLKRVVETLYAKGKIVSAICHGPAAFVNAKKPDGTPLVRGHRINCFTDAEERQVEKEEVVPFMLETKLRELGADFEAGTPFTDYTVEDVNLITGQNPKAAGTLAQRIIEALESDKQQAA